MSNNLSMKTLILLACVAFLVSSAMAEVWTVTAYCPCSRCCGARASGVMANGERAHVGAAAVNFLPFGTRLYVEGVGPVVVKDRGHKRYFGDFYRKVRRMDIFFPSHAQAVAFGVQRLEVDQFAPVILAGDCSILVW